MGTGRGAQGRCTERKKRRRASLAFLGSDDAWVPTWGAKPGGRPAARAPGGPRGEGRHSSWPNFERCRRQQCT